jgi:Cu/Ag efflux pump CusA
VTTSTRVTARFTVVISERVLYLNFRRVTETLIVMLSVPFALVGGLWLKNWSIRRRLKSSRTTSDSDSPVGCAMSSLDPMI